MPARGYGGLVDQRPVRVTEATGRARLVAAVRQVLDAETHTSPDRRRESPLPGRCDPLVEVTLVGLRRPAP